MTMLWTRESIWQAVFNAWSVPCLAQGMVLASRHTRHFIDVELEQLPAGFQFQKGENWKRVRGLPPAIEMRAEIFLYTRADLSDDANPQSTTINNYLDIIQNAFGVSNPDNNNTLNDTPGVQHIWIEDGVQIYEAVLEGLTTSICIIPLRVLVGSNVGS